MVFGIPFSPIPFSGILIIGFGEVIDLLQKIHDQNDPKAQVLQAMEATICSPIPLAAEQEIKEFYANQNIWVDSILPTKKRTIFIVKVNGRTEYIELGGYVKNPYGGRSNQVLI